MSKLEQFGITPDLSFSSDALTKEDYFRELADFTVSRRRSLGTVPPSVGVTVPYARDKITSADSLSKLDGLLNTMQKGRRGGAAFDMNASNPDDTYRQRRYDFLEQQEGVRMEAYDDETGRPVRAGQKSLGNVTVGVGFNMDRPDAKRVFVAATGLDETAFDEVYTGERKLNRNQVRALFEATIDEAESIVGERLKGVDLPEHERVALVSLAFNNPELVGPNLVAALKAGDRRSALAEILFKSNAKRHRGLAGRRYREGAMFAGPEVAQAALPDFTSYIKNFS